MCLNVIGKHGRSPQQVPVMEASLPGDDLFRAFDI